MLKVLRSRVVEVAKSGIAFRYFVTSGVNVLIHQSLLQVMVRTVGLDGGRANLIAALIVAVPAYFMSRHWVWDLENKPTFRGEILPFVLISLFGLVLSTATSAAADAAFVEPLLISVGSLAGYVAAWILKFLFLDRLLVPYPMPILTIRFQLRCRPLP